MASVHCTLFTTEDAESAERRQRMERREQWGKEGTKADGIKASSESIALCAFESEGGEAVFFHGEVDWSWWELKVLGAAAEGREAFFDFAFKAAWAAEFLCVG